MEPVEIIRILFLGSVIVGPALYIWGLRKLEGSAVNNPVEYLGYHDPPGSYRAMIGGCLIVVAVVLGMALLIDHLGIAKIL